jgi:coenzyme F420-reducing hydrogenase gamma subunit
VTTKKGITKLKKIRAKSKILVALGACACHGGIPAMRNFIENKELSKYIYNQKMLDDSIEAQPIDNFVKVDYYMRGCPILKAEFVDFIKEYMAGEMKKEFEGPVCSQCPRRGKDCFLQKKMVCLGALTHGGCNAACLREGIPCIMCRGPLKTANLPGEVALFKSWGLDEKAIMSKLGQFAEKELKTKKGEKKDA